jgi:hypothetical protein
MVFNAIEEQTIHWLKEKKDKRTCNNKTLHKLKIKQHEPFGRHIIH